MASISEFATSLAPDVAIRPKEYPFREAPEQRNAAPLAARTYKYTTLLGP